MIVFEPKPKTQEEWDAFLALIKQWRSEHPDDGSEANAWRVIVEPSTFQPYVKLYGKNYPLLPLEEAEDFK